MAVVFAIDDACLPVSVWLAYSPHAISLEFKVIQLSIHILLLLIPKVHWTVCLSLATLIGAVAKRLGLRKISANGKSPAAKAELFPFVEMGGLEPPYFTVHLRLIKCSFLTL